MDLFERLREETEMYSSYYDRYKDVFTREEYASIESNLSPLWQISDTLLFKKVSWMVGLFF